MRYFAIWITLIAISLAASGATKEEWFESYRGIIEKTKRDPIRKNLQALTDSIAANDRYFLRMDPDQFRFNNYARDELCKIPGHARYYVDEIKREQEAVKDVPNLRGARNDYDRHRGSVIVGVLAHLPSPETTQVLGDFLADDRDLLGQPRGFEVMANSSLAMQALRKIGLRNPPQTGSITDEPADIAIWRNWYEELKSGKRNFSFTGQKVEYRFKPDGTWETIALANAPDDAPKPASTIQRP